jgi:thioredoxin-related protein
MPDSAVDVEVTREARLAASDAKAGFVSVNASREKMIRELATEYDIRHTPTVLVFTRGPQLDNRLIGYVDQTTVAQAAVQALALSD